MQIDSIVSLFRTHAWVPLAWFGLTAVINTILRWKTPEELEAFAETNPTLARCAALIRRWGFEPVEGLQILASFFARNPPPPSGGDDEPPAQAPPAVVDVDLEPEPPTVRDVRKAPSIIAMAAAACLLLAGCSAAQKRTAVTIATTVADDVCHELEQQPEPEWVTLVCAVEGVATDFVRVRMPRAQWAAVRARHLDAGPGK
jgi:hypothetical protein